MSLRALPKGLAHSTLFRSLILRRVYKYKQSPCAKRTRLLRFRAFDRKRPTPSTQKPTTMSWALFVICREDRIRTCDPLVPNQVRYRPALLPETIFADLFFFHLSGHFFKRPSRLKSGCATGLRYFPKQFLPILFSFIFQVTSSSDPPDSSRDALPACATSRNFIQKHS